MVAFWALVTLTRMKAFYRKFFFFFLFPRWCQNRHIYDTHTHPNRLHINGISTDDGLMTVPYRTNAVCYDNKLLSCCYVFSRSYSTVSILHYCSSHAFYFFASFFLIFHFPSHLDSGVPTTSHGVAKVSTLLLLARSV